MLKVSNSTVMNFENAIRGARNPMNSWDKSDSRYEEGRFVLGPNDLSLACRLCSAGRDHRKFIRQIFVSVDIEAPIYWWKEFDTYKVGTVANSTSTMHKIHSRPFSPDQFSFDNLTEESEEFSLELLAYLESLRKKYLKTKDKALWLDIIKLLPSSYNQLRTVTLNYEVLNNIYHARKNHKLSEWHTFCDYIATLPYAKELIIIKED
ncbi:MAG: hypothetical protein GX633_02545 [Clostridiales bacterium]|nr:hypothetical protein [Clostridiales bacterium]